MHKKLIALIVTACMLIVGLIACGNNTGQKISNSESESAETINKDRVSIKFDDTLEITGDELKTFSESGSIDLDGTYEVFDSSINLQKFHIESLIGKTDIVKFTDNKYYKLDKNIISKINKNLDSLNSNKTEDGEIITVKDKYNYLYESGYIPYSVLSNNIGVDTEVECKYYLKDSDIYKIELLETENNKRLDKYIPNITKINNKCTWNITYGASNIDKDAVQENIDNAIDDNGAIRSTFSDLVFSDKTEKVVTEISMMYHFESTPIRVKTGDFLLVYNDSDLTREATLVVEFTDANGELVDTQEIYLRACKGRTYTLVNVSSPSLYTGFRLKSIKDIKINESCYDTIATGTQIDETDNKITIINTSEVNVCGNVILVYYKDEQPVSVDIHNIDSLKPADKFELDINSDMHKIIYNLYEVK